MDHVRPFLVHQPPQLVERRQVAERGNLTPEAGDHCHRNMPGIGYIAHIAFRLTDHTAHKLALILRFMQSTSKLNNVQRGSANVEPCDYMHDFDRSRWGCHADWWIVNMLSTNLSTLRLVSRRRPLILRTHVRSGFCRILSKHLWKTGLKIT